MVRGQATAFHVSEPADVELPIHSVLCASDWTIERQLVRK